MEHLIKQTENETIKRFELSNKNLWLVKKGTEFGFGKTKKEAEKNTQPRSFYALKGTPDFINELGTTYKTNKRPKVNSSLGMEKFIWQQIPKDWQLKYFFRTIINQEKDETCLQIAFVGRPEIKPICYNSDDKKGHHQQVLNCVYRFYIDLEIGLVIKEQNKKLDEWQRNWYSKLMPRRVHD